MSYIGIDIGSTNSKIVVIDDNENIIMNKSISTGISSKDSSYELFKMVENEGTNLSAFKIVATGYGRVVVDNANKTITEISCHAKGACKIFNADDLVIIDIGGQDTKIISVEGGFVKDFIMNDKCSAGTGRFLDVMARTMGISVGELVELAREGGGVSISSLCTVFAESEVISLIGKSEKKENIANAIVRSIVTKVVSQASKIDVHHKSVCLTGGLSDMKYIVELLSEYLKVDVMSDSMGKYAGAYGAALFARDI